tara:strand:- start:265 stop:855 length:591 start_codon:yes stop_codon:yes gene_type:complete
MERSEDMWAKRFPLPDFDHVNLKDYPWSPPTLLTSGEALDKVAELSNGDITPGCFAVSASDLFYENLNIEGENRHAILCVTPKIDIALIGRSHAWKKQRLTIVNSLEPDSMEILVDWRTARAMSTRLGPKEGITIPGGAWYVIVTNIISDKFIGNRSVIEQDTDTQSSGRNGFAILSSSEPEFSDFHDCNLYASWD